MVRIRQIFSFVFGRIEGKNIAYKIHINVVLIGTSIWSLSRTDSKSMVLFGVRVPELLSFGVLVILAMIIFRLSTSILPSLQETREKLDTSGFDNFFQFSFCGRAR